MPAGAIQQNKIVFLSTAPPEPLSRLEHRTTQSKQGTKQTPAEPCFRN